MLVGLVSAVTTCKGQAKQNGKKKYVSEFVFHEYPSLQNNDSRPPARARQGIGSVVQSYRLSVESLSLGSLNGASVCARAAVDALVSVDLVLAVSLVDSLGGAVLCASAAGDAIIANLVCHCSFLHTYLLTTVRGQQWPTVYYIIISDFCKGYPRFFLLKYPKKMLIICKYGR